MCSLFLILEDVPIEKQGRLEPQDVKGPGSLYSQGKPLREERGFNEIPSKFLTDHESSVSILLKIHSLSSESLHGSALSSVHRYDSQ